MEFLVHPKIEAYAKQYSKAEPEYLKKVREFTEKHTSNPQMLSGALEGNFLRQVVQLTNAKRILELGTFTGYSSLWMAEGMEDDGKIITCEASPEHAKISQKHFDDSPHAKKIEIKLAPALDTLEKIEGTFDIAFIDADKSNYISYYEKCLSLLRPGGSILVDNTLWDGKVLNPQQDDMSTKVIHQLNQIIAKDQRVTNTLMTIRDGIQWAIKK